MAVIDDNGNNNGNPLTDAGNGDGGDADGEGWEGGGGAPGGGRGGGSGGSGIFLLYDVKIFLCGENWQDHTSSHTLIMLEVSRRTFGWGW